VKVSSSNHDLSSRIKYHTSHITDCIIIAITPPPRGHGVWGVADGELKAEDVLIEVMQRAVIEACDFAHHTSHVTRHTSHITHHTSHIIRHTSHITHHTSHVTTGVTGIKLRMSVFHGGKAAAAISVTRSQPLLASFQYMLLFCDGFSFFIFVALHALLLYT
jgi:hypothetical protein